MITMSHGMELVDTPEFDALQGLHVGRFLEDTACPVVQHTVDFRVMRGKVLDNVQSNLTVFWVFHFAETQTDTCPWIGCHEPAIVEELDVSIFLRSAATSWSVMVTLGGDFFVPVDCEFPN